MINLHLSTFMSNQHSLYPIEPLNPITDLFQIGDAGFVFEHNTATMYQELTGTDLTVREGSGVTNQIRRIISQNTLGETLTAQFSGYNGTLHDEGVRNGLFEVEFPLGTSAGTVIFAKDRNVVFGDFLTDSDGIFRFGNSFSEYTIGICVINRVLSINEKLRIKEWYITKGANSQYIPVLSNAFAYAHTLVKFDEESIGVYEQNTTRIEAAWRNCSGLTSFPLIDTSNVTYMGAAWRSCGSLTSFPLIDTSNVTNMTAGWFDCTNLTSFPLIDTSKVTDMSSAWRSCGSLTSFPLIDTSNVTYMGAAWADCTNLTSFPLIDTSKVINMSEGWFDCTNLTSFPLIDTSKVTTLLYTWADCTNLTSFPSIDTSKVAIMGAAWRGCSLNAASINGLLIEMLAGCVANPRTGVNCTVMFAFGSNANWSSLSIQARNAAQTLKTTYSWDFTNAFNGGGPT